MSITNTDVLNTSHVFSSFTQSYAVCNTVPVRLTANAKLLLVLIISNHSHNHNYNEKQYKTMRAEQSRAERSSRDNTSNGCCVTVANTARLCLCHVTTHHWLKRFCFDASC